MPDSHLEAAYEERSELPDVYDDELEDQEDCDICGEGLERQEYGEFYNPDDPYPSKHYIAHADCGLSAGYELA